MSGRASLADLPPRLRKMLQLIVQHRVAILTPQQGCLELHFKGASVTARLVSSQGLRLAEEQEAEPRLA